MQKRFSDLEYAARKKLTRRDCFLAEIDSVTPWSKLHKLCDVHVVWCADGRFTLAGFERQTNTDGKSVDYAQSWLCSLDFEVISDIGNDLSKPRSVKPNSAS